MVSVRVVKNIRYSANTFRSLCMCWASNIALSFAGYISRMVKIGGRDISVDQGINLAIGASAVIDGAACIFAPEKSKVR
jgi:hypothetical protein